MDLQLGAGEDLSAGVGRGVEKDGPRLGCNGGLQGVGIEGEIWLGERDEDGVDAH